MTKEELIFYGKDYLYDLETSCCKIGEKHKEFVRESIKALQDKSYELWKESYEEEVARNTRLIEKIEALKQDPCEDSISREAVFETIDDCSSDGLKGIFCSYDDGERFKKYIKKLPSVTPTTKWIPYSEKLPKDRDWYLGIFKEPDTGWINPIPYICYYVGYETVITTKEYWVLKGYTDRDKHIGYYYNLECVAWQPLPIPYKTESEGKK